MAVTDRPTDRPPRESTPDFDAVVAELGDPFAPIPDPLTGPIDLGGER